MTLDDEIQAVEDVERVARGAASEHLDRAAKAFPLGTAGIARYQDFLDATLLTARSTLLRCRELASAPVAPADATASTVQSLLAGVRESVRLMYVAMTLLEQLAGSPRGEGPVPPRSCSFCGKTEAESKLAAGPAANICAPCTRLACGVLGIGLSDAQVE